jgi:hypothetical protein
MPLLRQITKERLQKEAMPDREGMVSPMISRQLSFPEDDFSTA